MDAGAEAGRERSVMSLGNITRGHYGKGEGSKHEASPKGVAPTKTKVYGSAIRETGSAGQQASGTREARVGPGRARYKGSYRRKSYVAEQSKQNEQGQTN